MQTVTGSLDECATPRNVQVLPGTDPITNGSQDSIHTRQRTRLTSTSHERILIDNGHVVIRTPTLLYHGCSGNNDAEMGDEIVVVAWKLQDDRRPSTTSQSNGALDDVRVVQSRRVSDSDFSSTHPRRPRQLLSVMTSLERPVSLPSISINSRCGVATGVNGEPETEILAHRKLESVTRSPNRVNVQQPEHHRAGGSRVSVNFETDGHITASVDNATASVDAVTSVEGETPAQGLNGSESQTRDVTDSLTLCSSLYGRVLTNSSFSYCVVHILLFAVGIGCLVAGIYVCTSPSNNALGYVLVGKLKFDRFLAH